jgi:hypothetical protein
MTRRGLLAGIVAAGISATIGPLLKAESVADIDYFKQKVTAALQKRRFFRYEFVDNEELWVEVVFHDLKSEDYFIIIDPPQTAEAHDWRNVEMKPLPSIYKVFGRAESVSGNPAHIIVEGVTEWHKKLPNSLRRRR